MLKPFKVVINSGNGAAGPAVDAINNKLKEKGNKTNFVFVHHDPDPTFPNGIPNPLLEETDHPRRMPLSLRTLTLAWPLTATTAVFSLINLETLFLGSMWWVSSLKSFKIKTKGHDHPRPLCYLEYGRRRR